MLLSTWALFLIKLGYDIVFCVVVNRFRCAQIRSSSILVVLIYLRSVEVSHQIRACLCKDDMLSRIEYVSMYVSVRHADWESVHFLM